MATFKYVGTFVKDNGKVDINVGSYSFADVTPNTYEITVADGSKEESFLEHAIDPFDNTYMYIKQS